MQAILLAAGKGSRLGKYTKNGTKCMVNVNNKKLIDRTLESLLNIGVKKIIIVVGYKKEDLKNYISEKYQQLDIKFIENLDYERTNNIYSLYLTKEEFMKDDTILLESDIIYEQSILEELITSKHKDIALVAKYSQWMDGTVVTTDNNQNILSFIDKTAFDYKNVDKYYKTVNIYKFSKKFINKFYINFLESYIKTYGSQDYYESVLKVIIGLKDVNLKALDVKDKKWYEIDNPQDLEIAELLFLTGSEKLEKYEKRYGGYWRFDKVLDYCYLVNPYFPTSNYIDRLNYFSRELITSYPSSLNIQNFLASSLFDKVSEKNIIIGNGATELINNLKHIIKGKLGGGITNF